MPVKAIEKLRPGKHACAPCLYIHVSRTGGRSWVYRYVRSGAKVDMGIGSYRELSRDEAIDKVAELQAQRKAGIDPLTARRDTAKADAEAAGVPTFRAAALGYHKANGGTWSASHAASWLKEMDREVMPAIGNVRVDRLDVADVLRALAGWTERHETVSRCRGRVEKVLDAQKVLGNRKGENPAAWKSNLENLLPSPKSLKRSRGENHHDAMDWKAVPQFVGQLPETDAGRALAFLTYTAARSAEVRDAVWSEIDFAARTWTIPAERMKARKEHVVALSGPALAILEGLKPPKLGGFIFSDLGRDAMSELMPSGSTVHGQRAAFSTWAGDLGLPRDVVERCLAHVTGSSTERAYRRGQEVEQKRQIMERWALYLAGENHNIVTLDAKRA